jgi:hypothetical protein
LLLTAIVALALGFGFEHFRMAGKLETARLQNEDAQKTLEGIRVELFKRNMDWWRPNAREVVIVDFPQSGDDHGAATDNDP